MCELDGEARERGELHHRLPAESADQLAEEFVEGKLTVY